MGSHKYLPAGFPICRLTRGLLWRSPKRTPPLKTRSAPHLETASRQFRSAPHGSTLHQVSCCMLDGAGEDGKSKTTGFGVRRRSTTGVWGEKE
jgi:hypothetical protein